MKDKMGTERDVPQLVPDSASCCGCGACFNICPRDAISMELDTHKFTFPSINPTLCIHCNLCLKVCAFKKDILAVS